MVLSYYIYDAVTTIIVSEGHISRFFYIAVVPTNYVKMHFKITFATLFRIDVWLCTVEVN